ncbi:MAG: ABC transporter ATP-binding protein [Phycicoccus sp.]|nr:ABC transporter ATP-binding protein [Phycicoccus sp.]
MAAVIETTDLVKTFGSVRALDGLDLTVAEGEVHGFLGPNGSGKSTTIRVLLGLLRSDSGRAQVLGRSAWHDATELHARLAYVPGDVTLWPNLTGGEIIDLLGRLRGGLNPARRAELIERFDLDPTKKGRSYSKGNRQKVALVAALAGDVELLLLDEPTSGLDPLMERVFQDLLRERHAQGVTVLLSSHILSEVEKACSCVSIVRDGRIVDRGTLAELGHLTRTHIEASVTQPVTQAQVAAWHGVHDPVVTDRQISLSVDQEALGATVAALDQLGIVALTSAPPSLEDLFLAHYDQSPART